MSSPTSRSLEYFREADGIAGVVERYNSFSGHKNDLFGFIDIVAGYKGCIWGVQATSASNRAARRKKILEEPLAKEWVKHGGRIMLLTWGKKKRPNVKGTMQLQWTANEEEIYPDGF